MLEHGNRIRYRWCKAYMVKWCLRTRSIESIFGITFSFQRPRHIVRNKRNSRNNNTDDHHIGITKVEFCEYAVHARAANFNIKKPVQYIQQLNIIYTHVTHVVRRLSNSRPVSSRRSRTPVTAAAIAHSFTHSLSQSEYSRKQARRLRK